MEVNLKPVPSLIRAQLQIGNVIYILEWHEVIALGAQITDALERYVAGQ